jgi:hypothetical protein
MSMIEKVARAIADRRIAEYGDYAGSGIREVEYAYARAALGAMKDPTKDMITAFVDDDVDKDLARARYCAMISAALNGGEGSGNVG